MAIKVWDYLKEYQVEREQILDALDSVFQSGQLILGEKVELFEKEYSAYCGVKYSVGVDNGTNAIFLALKALDIGIGDEVITVSNTAIPCVSAIVSAGATPVFADILEESFLLDASKLEALITAKTKAILVVHLYGQCVDMDEVIKIADNNRIPIIEDCAQSHGATYKGRVAGSMGLLAATSFYPTKILGTYGDGGMVSTNDETLYYKLKRLRFYGAEKSYFSVQHGYNSRLDEIHAAILSFKLARIETYLSRRREIARFYDCYLADTGLVLPKQMPYGKHSYYIYVVRHPLRDGILKSLRDQAIFLNISYPWPIHCMTGYHYLGYKEGDLPVTERLAKEIFSLPMYPSLSEEEQMQVCDALISLTN
jgi:aminotransferase EvaB